MFDHGSSDQLPRRARKAIEDTDEALRVVRSCATKSDLALSDGAFSLRIAIESTQSLLSVAKCHDVDSTKRLERIAPLWNLVAKCLRDRDELSRRVRAQIEHENKEDLGINSEGIEARCTGFVLGDLMKALGRLRTELDSR